MQDVRPNRFVSEGDVLAPASADGTVLTALDSALAGSVSSVKRSRLAGPYSDSVRR